MLMVLVFREKEDGDETAKHTQESITDERGPSIRRVCVCVLTSSIECVCVSVHHGGVLAAGDHQSHFLSGAQRFLPLPRQLPAEENRDAEMTDAVTAQ